MRIAPGHRPVPGNKGLRRDRGGSRGCGGPARSGGFTMLETMVSFVILGVGLLGMAALQGNALRYSNQAYLRSQAIIVAYDIFERMRANPAGVSGGHYAAEEEEGDEVREETEEEESDVNCTSSACTPAQLAAYDLESWGQSVSSLLPSGTGTLTNNGSNSYTVTIDWVEQKKARAVDEDPSDDSDRTLSITVTM